MSDLASNLVVDPVKATTALVASAPDDVPFGVNEMRLGQDSAGTAAAGDG